MDPSAGAVLEWLFGEEGSVAAEDEVQVVMAATGAVLSGVFLVSPIVAALAGPFAVSPAAAGQLVTAFTAPSIVLVPVFGVLADRYGPRGVLAGGLLCFGVAGGAVAAAPSFEVALLLRVVQGVGFAAVNPVGVAIIGDVYAGSRETTAQGLRVVSIQSVGMALPPVAGALVLVGWQYPFLLYLLTLPIAWWAWVSLPAGSRREATSLGQYVSDLRASLARPALGAVVVSFVARFAISFSFIAYVSVLLASLGASPVEIGLLLAMVGGVSILGSTQAGRVAASVDPFLALLVSFLALAAGMVVMGASASYPVVIGAIVLYGAAIGVSGPVQKSLVTQLSPAAVRGGTVSSALTFQSIGAAGGPFLMGVLLGRVEVGVTFVAFGAGLGLVGVALTAVAYLARPSAGVTPS